MHLRAVKIRGFKSFPDPVEVRLEPGVGVIVGPNGSGKSNVSDAIRWAAGSLSPLELRAEKPDDVLFAGAAGRGAADFCEVELLFDNADGTLPVDYAELSVARRLHRGGEGQYLLNKTAVRRIDLVELLADLGLGQGMHSIIGQGKVEAILASKPEERRALIEEAAGLGRFKARRHRAELKLTRVAIQVERARDLEAEVKKRLRPLALQATAAERAEKLRGELAKLRARIAELDLSTLDDRLAEAAERRAAAALGKRAAEERLEASARRTRPGGGGARGRRRCTRAGDAGAVPAAQCDGARRHAPRIGRVARAAPAGRARTAAPRPRRASAHGARGTRRTGGVARGAPARARPRARRARGSAACGSCAGGRRRAHRAVAARGRAGDGARGRRGNAPARVRRRRRRHPCRVRAARARTGGRARFAHRRHRSTRSRSARRRERSVAVFAGRGGDARRLRLRPGAR